MRVLVIDDDGPNRETLANVLTKIGHVVDTAINGLQAVEKVAKDRPDLAIVDLSLPDLNGRDVLGHLGGVPAIVWTGVPLGDEATLVGVVAVVVKPDVEGLLEAVRKAGAT